MPALHGLNRIAVQKPQGVCVVLAGIGQAQPAAQFSDWGMRRPGSCRRDRVIGGGGFGGGL